MANPNAPFGLRPSRSIGAANTQVNEYVHVAGDGTALYIGDTVTSTSTGGSSALVPYPDGTPICTASGTVTTGYIRGAVAGVRPTLTNLTLQYCPASTLLGILVYDDPFQLFDVQSGGTGVIADVSQNVGITSAAGSTYTGLSGYVSTEDNNTTDLVLRVIRLAPLVGNVLGQYNVWEVKINNHESLNTTGV